MKAIQSELKIASGEIIVVKYPFVRHIYSPPHPDDLDEMCWRPGVRLENVGPESCESVADGEGQQVFTVVSIHKPGKYPTRVFYTRKWIDPDGKTFGKGSLKMISANAFLRRISGYWNEYKVKP